MLSDESQIISESTTRASLEGILEQTSCQNTKDNLSVALKQLKRDEARLNYLEKLVVHDNDATVELDENGRILFMNQQAYHLFELSEENAIGKPFFKLTVEKDYLNQVLDIHKTTHNGIPYSGESFFHGLDNITFLGHYINRPIVGNDGEFHGSIITVKNLTEDQNKREALVRMQEALRLQLDVSLSFANMIPKNCIPVISKVIHAFGSFFDLKQVVVYSNTPINNSHWLAHYGEYNSIQTFEFTDDHLLWLEQHLHKNTYITEKQLNKELLTSYLQHSGAGRTPHFFPLINQGEYLGFLAFCSPSNQKLSQILLDTVQLFANNIAGAIQLFNQDKERKVKEEIFEAFSQFSSDGLAIRKDGRYTYLSPSYLKILGYSHDEKMSFSREDLYNLIHPFDRSATKQFLTNAVAERKTEVLWLYRILHKHGHYIWREDHFSFVYDDTGELQETFLVARDVTDRVHKDEELNRKERQAQALIEGIPDLIFRLDRKGRYLYYKARKEELIIQDTSIIGKNCKELLPRKIALEVEVAIERLFRSGEMQMIQYELDLPELGHRHYEARMVLSGEEEITALVRDITSDVESKKEITMLHSAIENSPMSVIVANKDLIITYVNKHFLTTSGHTKREIVGSKQPVFKSLEASDDDYKRIISKIQIGSPWSGEVLSENKQGEQYWESVLVTPLKESAEGGTQFLIVKQNISEIKALNRELKKLSFVASKTSDSIQIVDADLRIQWINQAFTNSYGYSLEETRGKTPSSILYGRDTNQEDAKSILEGIAQQKAFSKVMLHYTKDDDAYWMDCNFTPVFDQDGVLEKYIIVERDISQLVEAQKRIRSERNLLGTIIDHLPSLVFLKDLDSKRTLVNQADIEFQGKKTASELIGKTDYDLYPKYLADRFKKQDEEIIRTGNPVLNCEVLVNHPEGKKWFLLSKIPLKSADGEINGLLGIGKEVTDIKEREIELRESIGVIGDQNKRLKEFTYIVSHNIRSHAANLHSLIKLLELSANEAERQEYLSMLENVSSNQLKTLDNLNKIISIQGDTNMDLEYIRVKEIVVNTMEVLQPEILGSSTKIDLHISSKSGLYSNRPYFESIVLNLCSNAIKYRNPETDNKVEIFWIEYENKYILEVKDNGLGFDVERYKDRLFGMNQTFHNHPKARGIGLFLVKNQIEALGGSISVQSEPNIGSVFTVKFQKLKS